jgi:hypothetical protein
MCNGKRPVLCSEAFDAVGSPYGIHMDRYNRILTKCKAALRPLRAEMGLLDPYVLATSHAEFRIEGHGDLRIEDELGQGMYGKVFAFFGNSGILLKGAKSDHGKDDLCLELAVISALDGLNGGVPRIHKIEKIPSSLKSLFRGRVLVMDRRGDAEWSDIPMVESREFNMRFSRLIEIVRDMHDRGFVHNDIKPMNIRISTTYPAAVTLIDFDQAEPFIDSRGFHLGSASRIKDMEGILAIAVATEGPKTWLPEFYQDVKSLGLTDRPNYEKWIAFFRR